jgi:very-short-patch-repair endonuclease
MKASHHYSGSGCKECMKEKFRLNINDFIEMANIVHDNKYDYSLVDYINNRIKVIIICDKHGEFNPTAGNHLRGSGCPKCNSSKGEILIRNFLKSHNIEHEEQKKFKECINIKPLIFDFYLPNLNTIIEYQGLQHFKIIKRAKNWTNQKCNSILKRIQENDSIKREWCKNNNVKLIEINYNDNNPLDVLSKGLLFV